MAFQLMQQWNNVALYTRAHKSIVEIRVNTANVQVKLVFVCLLVSLFFWQRSVETVGSGRKWCSAATSPGLLAWKALPNRRLCPRGRMGAGKSWGGRGARGRSGGRRQASEGGGRPWQPAGIAPASLAGREGLH